MENPAKSDTGSSDEGDKDVINNCRFITSLQTDSSDPTSGMQVDRKCGKATAHLPVFNKHEIKSLSQSSHVSDISTNLSSKVSDHNTAEFSPQNQEQSYKGKVVDHIQDTDQFLTASILKIFSSLSL